MSQRPSGYARRADEEYPTPSWVAGVIADYLRQRVRCLWEPAAGHPALGRALEGYGFSVTATATDFFQYSEPPHNHLGAIVTNPPYGEDRRGAQACDFIHHALRLDVRLVCMLLRVDFDSAKTRVDLFRDHPHFAGKIVLLDRVKWFEGPSAPSDNHAWFCWDREHRGRPWICYARRDSKREGVPAICAPDNLPLFARTELLAAPPYDAEDDLRKSVEEGFRAIRARKAAGGPGWGER